MEIYSINQNNILTVSEFMSELKPEWWNIEGASQQLSSGTGWYIGTVNNPVGWILCKPYELYRTGEIECLGYSKSGDFMMGEELQPLIQKAEEWANRQGYTNMRFTIGSKGLSCHNRDLKTPWEELRDIQVLDNSTYNFFLSMGYLPSGILPNIYGDKYHGILLVKTL